MPGHEVQNDRGSQKVNTLLTKEQIDEKAGHLLAQMSLKEKIQQMSGSTSLFPGLFEVWLAYNRRPLPAPKNDRLTIPAFCWSDGPRGKVAAANPGTAVVMVGGSAIITEAWRDKVPAILMAWYPGMEGGHALADILLGKVNPSGKLPCIFPKSKSQLPFFNKRAKSIEYGYFHGYRLMDNQGEVPAFPCGFGLSYTTFEYNNLQIDRNEIGPDEDLKVSVDVTNTGNVGGDEVVQLYVGYEGSGVERPVKELKGFSKVHLEPGQTRHVDFSLAAKQLAYYDEQQAEWIVEPLDYTVYAGPSSRMEDLLGDRFRISG